MLADCIERFFAKEENSPIMRIMFLLDPVHPIYSTIVEVVSINPGVSIADLHSILRKKMRMSVSLAHLYRIVMRMIDTQILIKVHGKIMLNLMWVSYVGFVMQRAGKIASHAEGIVLKEGEKRVFDAHSLFEVEAIWNHILVSLYGMLRQKKLHKYYSHAWWQFGANAEDAVFYRSLKEKGIECRWIFGSNTFLDSLASKILNETFEAVVLKEPPFPKEGYSLNVYGDYIIESLLPDSIAKHFSLFFSSVKVIKDFDQALFTDLFLMRGKYKVTVWRSPKQAELLREKLNRYFRVTGSPRKR